MFVSVERECWVELLASSLVFVRIIKYITRRRVSYVVVDSSWWTLGGLLFKSWWLFLGNFETYRQRIPTDFIQLMVYVINSAYL